MRRHANRPVLLALVASLVIAASLGGQAPKATGDPRAHATIGHWWIDAVFPAMPLREAICPGGYSTDPDRARRFVRFGWGIIARPPEPTNLATPFLSAWVGFELPRSVPLTPVRVDSALKEQKIVLHELGGEPPSVQGEIALLTAWARVANGRVRMRLEGEAAIRELLRVGSGRLTLNWCGGSVSVPGGEATV